ncbi:MAG: relaxase/mobilization nuclease domain-containing protein [Muribaculum sp.]|nr:relaxase/mobilization nuclease domain-containing protein [Muribaculum sp.]
MVAKIYLGNSLYGALNYNGEKLNKEKGKLLDSNKIFNDGSGRLDIHRAFEDFKRWMPAHTRTERPMMHISLNPHPDDRLTDTEYAQLAHEYMEKMGFGDMPYLIFKHEDIDRHHIHIVALRVRPDGTAISDQNNFYHSKDICRELEKKYGLKPAERQRITPDMPITKLDPNGDIKRQVANIVKMVGMRWKFQSIGEFNAILSLYNIRCEQTDGRVNGREYHGLVYFALDDNGNTIAQPFKASRLGKFTSRTAIDNRFERAKDKIDVRPTKKNVADVVATSIGKDDFIDQLKEKGIDLILRYTSEGRIYGATFLDHNTMTVLNGSRLGKVFSANAFERWFNGDGQKPIVSQQLDTTQTQSSSQSNNQGQSNSSPTPPDPNQEQNRDEDTRQQEQSQEQRQPHTESHSQHQSHTSQSHSNDDYYQPSLPGLDDLFHVGPGFDPEEEAFYRAMQRRKKKKRRGPKL